MKPVLCPACRTYPCACPEPPAAVAGVLGGLCVGAYALLHLLAAVASWGWLS